MKARILLVEDDAALVRGLRFNLEREGYEVESVGEGAPALELGRTGGFDLVLLDLNLPDRDGLDVLRGLRAEGVRVPLICLTARGSETDVVTGLGMGADDYVPKPFGVAELLARIDALLRRSGFVDPETLRLGSAAVDLMARRVRRRDGEEELTPIEIDLLRYLAARRGQAVERRTILADLWGLGPLRSTRTLDNHVARLRRKVEDDPSSPRWLVTVHGVGYRLEAEGESS
jgi:DNA-binding response OmpR family regulator